MKSKTSNEFHYDVVGHSSTVLQNNSAKSVRTYETWITGIQSYKRGISHIPCQSISQKFRVSSRYCQHLFTGRQRRINPTVKYKKTYTVKTTQTANTTSKSHRQTLRHNIFIVKLVFLLYLFLETAFF